MADILKTDCSKCAALCCVAYAFDKGEDFAFNKNPGQPCPNLSGHKCKIHADLTKQGFRGCVAYDCLGAGNRVVQDVFAGRSWQTYPNLLRPMMETFRAMCEVHQRIDLLRAAETLPLTCTDETVRASLLAQLTDQKFSGEALMEFESGLGLEIDVFIHELRKYVADRAP